MAAHSLSLTSFVEWKSKIISCHCVVSYLFQSVDTSCVKGYKYIDRRYCDRHLLWKKKEFCPHRNRFLYSSERGWNFPGCDTPTSAPCFSAAFPKYQQLPYYKKTVHTVHARVSINYNGNYMFPQKTINIFGNSVFCPLDATERDNYSAIKWHDR